MNKYSVIKINALYNQLQKNYQVDNWWFNNDPYYIIIGAILAQNIKWENVLVSLKYLDNNIIITPQVIMDLDLGILISYIKSSGFASRKALYLKNITSWYIKVYPNLKKRDIRESLLKVKGIGPETCDSIMLYAFNIPVFVIDNYTLRFMQRLGYNTENNYASLQTFFHNNIHRDVMLYKNFHALIVEHAKAVCTKKPSCYKCQLAKYCERRGV